MIALRAGMGNFVKMAVFHKFGTFQFRSCNLKSILVLDLGAKEENEWKNDRFLKVTLTA